MIKIPNLCDGCKTLWVRWRFQRCTKHLDRQIADARKSHKPVNHLLAAKRDFVHSLLAS